MQSPLARRFSLAAAATAVAVVASLVGVAAPAQAADRTITVSSQTDGDPNGACTDSSVLTTGSPVTLRAALCVAGNLGGSTIVSVPSGTYTLSQGAIAFGSLPGTSIEIDGATSTTIVGGGTERVFTIDENLVGGIAVSISDLTISHGADDQLGGGAIIAGSGYAGTADSLTVTNTVFDSNSANANGGSTANHGGAIQFAGGSLRISSSTFTGNSAGVADGGAVFYQATGSTPGETLSIADSSFAHNTATASGANGGAAVAVSDTGGSATMSITRSTFDANTVSGGSGTFTGGALWLNGGALTVTGSVFTGSTASTGEGSAIAVSAGTLTGSSNRVSGNAAPAVRTTAGGTALLTRTWWGCAGGPGTTGCDSVAGGVATAPYLTFALAAAPASIVQPAQTTTVTATVTDSTGGAATPADLAVLAGVPITWAASGVTGASVSPAGGSLSSGQVSTVLTSSRSGVVTVRATAGTTVTLQVPVYAPPSITSGALATGVVGVAGSFTVAADGYPTPALSLTGTLPAGVTFTDNGNGTALLSGTPTGAAADYPVTITAANAGGTATQSLTYSLFASPAFSSANAAAFTAGTPGVFTVTTTGRPAADPITLTGTLPAGVTFTDHHDGTATLGGTPAAGSGGTYSLVLTADNGKGTAAQQSFTLTVNEAPVFTSTWEAAVTVGDPVTIAITTANGHPTPAITAGAALPAGLTLTDNHDGTASIAGTPTGPGGTVTVPLTADNGVTIPATGSLVITVRERPAVTLALTDQSVVVGSTVAFTATASGYPAPAVSWSVSTDGGGSWTPIAGQSSTTLSFVATAGDDGNRYRATFANTVGTVSTDARLAVGTSPAFSSPAGTAFPVDGSAHSFTVTTSGFPDATLTASGTLPAWLSFAPGTGGRATLTGTPPAGSGGVYPFTITAANGYQPDAVQSFALTVTEATSITSAGAATFAAGTPGSFTVTTHGGYPAPAALSLTGSLPAGLSFVDRGDGTGTLSGTPAAGSGGTYALQFTADNGRSAVQSFDLTVTEAASFSSAATLDVHRGVAVNATIATTHAYPAVTAIALTGTLPAGLTFTSAGATATIQGTTLDAAGTVTVQLTASAPGSPDVTQTLTIAVADVPVALLPLTPPSADGPLAGVPSAPTVGSPIDLVAAGFAADSPVTFGLYSSPVVLAVENADAQGTARATVIIPAGYSGPHSLVAIGTAPDGSTRVLRTDIVLPAASGGGGSGSGGSGSGAAAGSSTAAGPAAGSGLADTGLDVGGLLLLALALLAGGAAALVRRRVRA